MISCPFAVPPPRYFKMYLFVSSMNFKRRKPKLESQFCLHSVLERPWTVETCAAGEPGGDLSVVLKNLLAGMSVVLQ